MSKEPKVDHAPWRDIEPALDAYEARAARWLKLVVATLGLALLAGVVGLYLRASWAPLALVPLFGGRLAFALWNTQQSPRCPGCNASLGWDFRGSPTRTRAIRREHACPRCGIPFVG